MVRAKALFPITAVIAARAHGFWMNGSRILDAV
jgi:hypothetical protein